MRANSKKFGRKEQKRRNLPNFCLAIVNTGVNMITMVPNNVLSWIGGATGIQLGEGMQQHTQGAASGLSGAGGVAGQVMKGVADERTKAAQAASALKGADKAADGTNT